MSMIQGPAGQAGLVFDENPFSDDQRMRPGPSVRHGVRSQGTVSLSGGRGENQLTLSGQEDEVRSTVENREVTREPAFSVPDPLSTPLGRTITALMPEADRRPPRPMTSSGFPGHPGTRTTVGCGPRPPAAKKRPARSYPPLEMVTGVTDASSPHADRRRHEPRRSREGRRQDTANPSFPEWGVTQRSETRRPPGRNVAAGREP